MRRPTETAASDTLKKVFARFFVYGWAGADLLGRLRLCLFIFIAAIFTLIAVAVILTGIFFPHETTALSLQLDRFEHNLKTHFDHVTAHGIYFSQRAAMEIEKTLLEQGAAFEDVSDSQKLIAALEKDTYPLVYEVLRLAEGNCLSV